MGPGWGILLTGKGKWFLEACHFQSTTVCETSTNILILNIPFPLGLVVEINLQITIFIFAQKLHKYGGITFMTSAERTCYVMALGYVE
jgi:hypothetical protein